MAERVGFEPTKGSHPCRFSRPVHSTALPPLRRRPMYVEQICLSTFFDKNCLIFSMVMDAEICFLIFEH